MGAGRKYGKRRVHVVVAAEKVMAHLVGAKNAEQRAAVPESPKNHRPVDRDTTRRELLEERGIMQGAYERGAGNGEHEQHHVQP